MFNTCQILLILVLGAAVTDCWEVGGRPVRRVAVWRTRAFLCVPRSDDEDAEAPATLLEAVWPEKGSIPTSYPNFDMQEVGNCSAFQSVVALDVEVPRARLWILDAGGHGCEPKLVIFELNTNRELLHIELTDTPGKWLSSLVVDSTGAMAPHAYIGDSGRGGLLVYSLRDRRWWQLDLKDAGTPVIAWDLALSRREPLLYITSPDTELMFGLNLIDLRRNHAPPVYDSRPVSETASVQLLGRKLGLSAGLVMDHRSGLHYFLLRDSSVVRWDTRRPLSPEAHSIAFHSTELLPVTAHLFVCPHRQVWAVVSTENKHPLPTDSADDIILSRNIRQIYDNDYEGTLYTSDKLDTTHDTPATESLSNYLRETLQEYYRADDISEHTARFNIFGTNGDRFSEEFKDIRSASDTQDNFYAATEREVSTPFGLENDFQTSFLERYDQAVYEDHGELYQTKSDIFTFVEETEKITEGTDRFGTIYDTPVTEALFTLQGLFWNSTGQREDEEIINKTESSNFTSTDLHKATQDKSVQVEQLGHNNTKEIYDDGNKLVFFENSQQKNTNGKVNEFNNVFTRNTTIMYDFISSPTENKTENQSEIKTDGISQSQNIPREFYLIMTPKYPLLHEMDELPSAIRINRESALNKPTEMLGRINGENQFIESNSNAEVRDFESIMIDQGGIDSFLQESFEISVATNHTNISSEYLEELSDQGEMYFDGEFLENMPFSALDNTKPPSSVLFTSTDRSTMPFFFTLSKEEVQITAITEDKDEGLYSDKLSPGSRSVDELEKLRVSHIANEQLTGNVFDNSFKYGETAEQSLSASVNPLYIEDSRLIHVNNVSIELFLSEETSDISFSGDGEYNNTSVPAHDLVGDNTTDDEISSSSDNSSYFPIDEEVSCKHRLEEGKYCSDRPLDTSHLLGEGSEEDIIQSSPYETDFPDVILDEYLDKELQGINRLPDDDIDILHLIPDYNAEEIQDTARDAREMSNIIRDVQCNGTNDATSSDESSRTEEDTQESNDTLNLHSNRKTDTGLINLRQSIVLEHPNTIFNKKTSSIVSYEVTTSVDNHINNSALLDNINMTDTRSKDEPTIERTRHDNVEYTVTEIPEDESSSSVTSYSITIFDILSNSMMDDSVISQSKLTGGTTFPTERTEQQVKKINIEKSNYNKYLITDELEEEAVTKSTQPSTNNFQSPIASKRELINSQNDARIMDRTNMISSDTMGAESGIHSQNYVSVTEAYSDGKLDKNKVDYVLLGPNDLQPVIRSFRALPKQYLTTMNTVTESVEPHSRSIDIGSENGAETIQIPFHSETDEKPIFLRATNAAGTEIYRAPPNTEFKIQLPDIAVPRKETVDERVFDNNIVSNAYSDVSETNLHMDANVQEHWEPTSRTQPLCTSNEEKANCIERCFSCGSIPFKEWSNYQDKSSLADSERLTRKTEKGRQGEDKIDLENVGINTVKYFKSRKPTFLIDLGGEDIPENNDHNYSGLRLVCNREGTLPATELESHAVVSRSQNSPEKRENLNSNSYQGKGNSDIYLGIEPDNSAVDFISTNRQEINTFRRGKPMSLRGNPEEQLARERYFFRKSGEPLRIGSLGSYSRDRRKNPTKTNDGSLSTTLLDSILGIASSIAKAFIPTKEKSTLSRVSSGRTMNRGTSNFVRKPAVTRGTKPKGRDDVVSLVAQCYGEECHAMVLLDKNKAQNVKESPLRSLYPRDSAEESVITTRKGGENSALYNYADRSRLKNPFIYSAGGNPVRFTVKLADTDGAVVPNGNMSNLILYIDSNEDLYPAEGLFDEKEIINPVRTFNEDILSGFNRLSRALTNDSDVVSGPSMTNDSQALYSTHAPDIPKSNLDNEAYLRFAVDAENSERVFSDSVNMSNSAHPSGDVFNSSSLPTLEENPTLITNSAEDMQVSESRKKDSVSICYDDVSTLYAASSLDTRKQNVSNSTFKVHAVEITETAGDRQVPELPNEDIFSDDIKASYVSHPLGADELNLSNYTLKEHADKITDTAVDMQELELPNEESVDKFDDDIKTSYVSHPLGADELNLSNSTFKEHTDKVTDTAVDIQELELPIEESVDKFYDDIKTSYVSHPLGADEFNLSNSTFKEHADKITDTAVDMQELELPNEESVDKFDDDIKTSYVSHPLGADELNLSNSTFKEHADKVTDTALDMQVLELVNEDSVEIFSYPRDDEHNLSHSNFSTLNEQSIMKTEVSEGTEVLETRDKNSVEVFMGTANKFYNVLPSGTAKPYFSSSKLSSFTTPIIELTTLLDVENPVSSKSGTRYTNSFEEASSDAKVAKYVNGDVGESSKDSHVVKTLETLIPIINTKESSSKNLSMNASVDSGQNIPENTTLLVYNQTDRSFMNWTANTGNTLGYFDKPLVKIKSKAQVMSTEATVDKDEGVSSSGESIGYIEVLGVTETNNKSLDPPENLMNISSSDSLIHFQNIKNISPGNMRGNDGENITDPSLTLDRVLLNNNNQIQNPPSLQDAHDDTLNKEVHEISLWDTKREGRELSKDGAKIWSNNIMDVNVIDTPTIGLSESNALVPTTTSPTTKDSVKGGQANSQNILIKINAIAQPYVKIPQNEYNPSTLIRVSDQPFRRHSSYTRETRQNKGKRLIPKAFQFISLSSNLKTWTVHCILIQKYPPHIP